MNTRDILNSYQEKKAKIRRFWIIFIFTVITFIIINFVMHNVIFPVKQHSVSMLPDIPQDSVIMTSPLATNFDRGDIVVMDSLTEKNDNFLHNILNVFTSFFTGQQINLDEKQDIPGTKQKLRRVVGLPGDTIYMRDYVLYVKPWGEKHFLTEFEIAETPYNVTFYVAPANWDSSIGTKGSFDEFVLADDEYFVLADNRKSTDDSRLWGPVTKNEISSKALFCYFPFNELKLF